MINPESRTREWIESLASEIIEDQTLNKLNRLKKVNTEAFLYARRLEVLG